MATHPADGEPFSPEPESPMPNPTHLPVEPEFAPQLPPSEPQDAPGHNPPAAPM